MASWAAALKKKLVRKYHTFSKEKKVFAKMNKKVPSHHFCSHPVATPETDLFFSLALLKEIFSEGIRIMIHSTFT